MSDKRWHLLYRLEPKPDGITRDEIPPECGGCDAALVASILYPPDGSLSVLFVSGDGRTGEPLPDSEWFKVWSLLAHRLAESPDLSPEKRRVCGAAFSGVRDFIESVRKEPRQ